MVHETLERLLTTLDVALHGFAVCNVDSDARLLFEPMDMIVIHYVLRGNGALESAGLVPIPFGPGHMLIVPAGSGQALTGSGPIQRDFPADEHCAMLVDGLVRFDAAPNQDPNGVMTICSTLSATYGGSFGLFDKLSGPLVRDMTPLAVVRAAFDQLLEERLQPDVGTHALTEAVMKQCLVLLVRAELHHGQHSSPLLANLRDSRLAATVTEVLRAPAAPRTVQELAQIAGMSRSAFASAFTRAFGQTPMDFVQKARLHHATRLLSGTGLPIKVIAGSMGFRSRSHFSRAFRSAYGIDPRRFRARRQNAIPDPPEDSGRGWLTHLVADGSIGGAEA